MNAKRLEAIKAREQKATEGPWREWYAKGIGCADAAVSAQREGEMELCLSGKRHKADSSFIAHSRQDIPDLVAALEVAVHGLHIIASSMRDCDERKDARDTLKQIGWEEK